MLRALLVLLLVGGGAAAIAHGLDIRKQLRAQLEDGFGAALRSAYVATSSTQRERVANYRWWSWMLIGGGCGALAIAVGGGMVGGAKKQEKAKKEQQKEKKKGRGSRPKG